MSAFDIPEQQICVYYPDPGHSWHHRILLLPCGAPGRWIVCSTDYDVEVMDLAEHLVTPLSRGLPFPPRVAGPPPDFYSRQPVDMVALTRAREEARGLALVLGVTPQAAAGVGLARWTYSDTAHEKFGQPVDDELLRDPALLIHRESVGLLNTPGEGWTTVENIRVADLDAWREEKSSGPGRDPRVLPVQRDAQRAKFRTVREALGEVTLLPAPPPGDWPFRGPSAVHELMTSIRAVSDDVAQYHEHFLRSSGLGADHPAAIKHREMLSVFMHLTCYDQLNVPQLAGAEACSRYIMQIHQATKRNPKAPDFRGLGLMVMSRLDASGGVLTGDFAKFVAEEQKSEAFTLKQQRLFAEEEEKRKAAKKGGEGKP